MGQLTIYMDDDTLGRISKSARKDKDSVSAWIKKRLTGSLEGDWPSGYFEVFGALKDSGLVRPVQPNPTLDKRAGEL